MHRGDRPGGVLRLPGQPAESSRRRRPPADHLAEHPDRRSPHRPTSTATSILVRGIEPNMRWRSSVPRCCGLRRPRGELVITLGALLADTPHTRPIPVTGTATEPDLVDRLKLEQSTYEGPTGIVGVFQDACVRLDDTGRVVLGGASPTTSRSRRAPRPPSRCCGQVEDLLEVQHPARRAPRAAAGGSAASTSWRRGGRGRRRVRPRPGGDARRDRPPD